MEVAVTILLTAHMKPFLGEALRSVAAQTRTDYECIVIDSGAWQGGDDATSDEMAVIHSEWSSQRRFTWFFTGEKPGEFGCPVGEATNLAIRSGLVRGRYVCHFYDDDEYYPTFIEKMAGYLDDNPDRLAVWCSQDRVKILRNTGERQKAGNIPADRQAMPGSIDCRVDGAQVMYRAEVLDAIGDPWVTTSSADCFHSDGIFLERLAAIADGLSPLPETLLAHRNTPLSTYSPT